MYKGGPPQVHPTSVPEGRDSRPPKPLPPGRSVMNMKGKGPSNPYRQERTENHVKTILLLLEDANTKGSLTLSVSSVSST